MATAMAEAMVWKPRPCEGVGRSSRCRFCRSTTLACARRKAARKAAAGDHHKAQYSNSGRARIANEDGRDLLGSCDDNTTSGRCRAKAAGVAVGTDCASDVRPSMAPTRHLLLCSLQGLAAMERLTAKHFPHSTDIKAANYWESVLSGHIDAANNVFVGAKRPSA